MYGAVYTARECTGWGIETWGCKIFGPYVLSGGPLIFNVILFKRKAVYTEGAGPVCKCTGQCTLEGSILLF